MKRYILTLFTVFILLASLAACSGEHVHTNGEWETKTAAGCSAAGLEIKRCTECGEVTEQREIAPAHRLTAKVEDATCTKGGRTYDECTLCGFTEETGSIEALGHTCTEYEIYNNDTTVKQDGSVYATCSRCGEHGLITLTGSARMVMKAFYGKKVSIIGDSISTYVDVSNGAAAKTANTTLSKNSLYYYQTHNETLGVELNDTWWMQVIGDLGAELLVNNSDSGSYIKDSKSNGNPGAYVERAVNLHDNIGAGAGTEPDIVFVYLGTNDFGKYYNSFGDVNSIDFEKLGEKCGADYTPTSVAEAYAIMLYKITTEYENAEVYCLNVLDSTLWKTKSSYLPEFNAGIAEVAKHFGAILVDIWGESGIKNDESFEDYIPSYDGDDTKNTLHPNAAGFRLIADVVLQAISENSKYYPDIFSTLK